MIGMILILTLLPMASFAATNTSIKEGGINTPYWMGESKWRWSNINTAWNWIILSNEYNRFSYSFLGYKLGTIWFLISKPLHIKGFLSLRGSNPLFSTKSKDKLWYNESHLSWVAFIASMARKTCKYGHSGLYSFYMKASWHYPAILKRGCLSISTPGRPKFCTPPHAIFKSPIRTRHSMR